MTAVAVTFYECSITAIVPAGLLKFLLKIPLKNQAIAVSYRCGSHCAFSDSP
jgi:hypothetical protein